MPALPTGTVTFLFTDIEGSTRLLQELGDRYAEVLAQQRELLRSAFQAGGGQEVDSQGDAFFVAFPRARDALTAAIAAQRAVAAHAWPERKAVRVRMGLHTGEPLAAGSGYVGMDVHRAARICAAGYGGQILLSQTARDLVAEDLPEGVILRDLGPHRLKDLATPQHLYQVVVPDLPADFPPLKSLDTLPNNLPRQLTSFIGRERELEEVKGLLSRTYLLTLTGAGGCGKTRLAIQVAADVLEQSADGVWLIELAALSDAGLVAQTVASALGVREQPGWPLPATLIDYLQPKQILILLDNCEHLLSASAALAATLLQACPHLRILATSREGLGIAGELTYPVPSLSLPDLLRLPPLESLAQQEAIRLFVERATFALPSFSLTLQNARAVAEVCSRLDGIPLAIEFAAARIKGMSVALVAGRLDERFRLLTGGSRTALPRHQTLRAAMDWSYELLAEPERILLRRLSVFSGGWTLEAAEAVSTGEGIEAPDVLDLLLRLVDKSLVIAEVDDGETRYRFLETVRHYGRDKLLESGEPAAVRERHTEWFVGLAERAAPELTGPHQAAWMQRLEVEYYNLRAALEWSRGADGNERQLRLAAALWRFWNVRGYWSEGREWLEDALSRWGAASPARRANAFFGAGVLAWWQQDDERMSTLVEESLALARELGDRRLIADCLRLLGHLAWDHNDLDRAKALGEESLVLFRELGDKPGISAALRFLGIHGLRTGEIAQAQPPLEESRQLARVLGDERGIATSVNGLGTVAYLLGDYERARGLLEEALALFREVGDKAGIGGALADLADVVRVQGDYARAAALHAESLVVLREIQDKVRIAASLGVMGFVALEQGDLEQARTLHEESLVLCREMGRKVGVADSLRALGLVAHYEDDHARATVLLEESLNLFREVKNRWNTAWSLDNLGTVARHRGHFKRAAELHREALALRQELGDRRGVAESLEGLAAVAAAEGTSAQAARLFGAAEGIRERIGAPLPPVDRVEYDSHVGAVRRELGDEGFLAAWAEGDAMAFDEACAYGLREDITVPDSSAQVQHE